MLTIYTVFSVPGTQHYTHVNVTPKVNCQFSYLNVDAWVMLSVIFYNAFKIMVDYYISES